MRCPHRVWREILPPVGMSITCLDIRKCVFEHTLAYAAMVVAAIRPGGRVEEKEEAEEAKDDDEASRN